MINKTTAFLVLTFAMAGLAQGADSAPATAVCAACHGVSGEGMPAMSAPRIAGQDGAYLARQLANFKTGRRAYHPDDKYGAAMRATAANLSDADIAALSAHYSKLVVPAATIAAKSQTDAKGVDLQAGKALYDGTCAACHGLQAQGYPQLQAPSLRVLDSAYLTRQVASFVNGWRGDAEKSDQPAVWMRSIASHLASPVEVDAVARYIAALAPAPAHQ